MGSVREKLWGTKPNEERLREVWAVLRCVCVCGESGEEGVTLISQNSEERLTVASSKEREIQYSRTNCLLNDPESSPPPLRTGTKMSRTITTISYHTVSVFYHPADLTYSVNFSSCQCVQQQSPRKSVQRSRFGLVFWVVLTSNLAR